MDGLSRRSLLKLPLVLAMPQTNLNQLPANLPRPKDDGGARHLKGMALPDLELPSTRNRRVNLSTVSAPRIVIYVYPMTGRPDRQLPQGWDDIPGARGCTPETCGFRDHHKDLAKLHVRGDRQHRHAAWLCARGCGGVFHAHETSPPSGERGKRFRQEIGRASCRERV